LHLCAKKLKMFRLSWRKLSKVMSIFTNDEHQSLSHLGQVNSSLRSRQEFAQLRMSQLDSMVGQAKNRVKRQPKVQEYLEKLQEVCHQKSVGMYEELLSAVVDDVLPGGKKVSLTLKTLRGLPSLDIEMVKGEGERESILDGSGGALTNILSAGLRVIALARSGAYPFLVLDEPDCWLKPSRVPQFANVLGQIATELNIQVLLISHHDSDFFTQFSSQLRLERRGGELVSSKVGDWGDTQWDGAKSGIKELRLYDFMSHSKTVLSLSPGVTCLTGENDIGKSAIVSALRALFYGTATDSSIAHSKTQFKIEALFHDHGVLSMERYLKKSPKQRWRYFISGQVDAVQDSSPKDGAPDWVDHIAKIARTEEMDIAFSNQKSPVFLLDQPASRRAAILAVGTESAHLQRLIAKNKERNLLDGRFIKDGEAEGAKISRELDCLIKVDEFGAEVDRLRKEMQLIESNFEEKVAFREKFDRLQQLKSLDGDSLFDSRQRIVAPQIVPMDDLNISLSGLRKVRALSKLSVAQDSVKKPVILDVDSIRERVANLKCKKKIGAIFFDREGAVIPSLQLSAKLLESMEKLMVCNRISGLEFNCSGVLPPSVQPTRQLMGATAGLKKLISISNIDFAKIDSASFDVPKMISMDKLTATIELVGALSNQMERFEKLEEQRLKKVQFLDNKIDETLASIGGVCPTCSGTINASQIKLGSHDD